jgi:ankyrin repeat protein
MQAVDQGDCFAAGKLLNEGINVHAKDKDGNTAIYRALKNWNPEVVALLIDHGANPGLSLDQGWIESYKNDPDAKDDKEKTILLQSAAARQWFKCQYLVGRGAMIRTQEANELLALAVTRRDLALAKKCIEEYNADPNAKGDCGKTAAALAVEKRQSLKTISYNDAQLYISDNGNVEVRGKETEIQENDPMFPRIMASIAIAKYLSDLSSEKKVRFSPDTKE